MRTISKIITAVALAGMAVAGGSAFTATGVTNAAGASQTFGGTVGQSVSVGVSVSNIHYTLAADGQTATDVSFTLSATPSGTVSAAIKTEAVPEASPLTLVATGAPTYTAVLTTAQGLAITNLDITVGGMNLGT